MNGVNAKLKETTEEFDCLCVGTSIIVSLEASYQASLGKKILMVDRDATFGGAWKTIEIAGIKGVENAIHYFTPDDKGIKFMREELKWPVEVSRGKYRYFNFRGKGYVKFAYDSVIGRLVDSVFYSDRSPGFVAAVVHFFKCIFKVVREPSGYLKGETVGRSYYVADGAVGIINSLKSLLSRYQIDIRFNSNIKKIFFDLENSIVHCQIGAKNVFCKTLILGHGARLPPIESTNGVLVFNEKIHPRPAFHLVVEDDTVADSLEVIFAEDSLIKYAHDVSRFSSLGKCINDKRKVFVFALQSHIVNSDELPNRLFEKLKDIGIIGKNAKITASLYSDVILPTLDDEDLYILKDAVGDLVNVLRTENLSNGIGYYADKWKS